MSRQVKEPRCAILASRKTGAAPQAPVSRGARTFFTLCAPGAAQGANFLGVVSSMEGERLRPAVDLEFGGNCGARPSMEAMFRELHQFLAVVEPKFGCRAVLYMTQDFHDAYVRGRMLDRELWIRDIYGRPSLAGRRWTLWQFANRARMAGVEPYVDLNAFDGSPAEFAKMICGSTH